MRKSELPRWKSSSRRPRRLITVSQNASARRNPPMDPPPPPPAANPPHPPLTSRDQWLPSPPHGDRLPLHPESNHLRPVGFKYPRSRPTARPQWNSTPAAGEASDQNSPPSNSNTVRLTTSAPTVEVQATIVENAPRRLQQSSARPSTISVA